MRSFRVLDCRIGGTHSCILGVLGGLLGLKHAKFEVRSDSEASRGDVFEMDGAVEVPPSQKWASYDMGEVYLSSPAKKMNPTLFTLERIDPSALESPELAGVISRVAHKHKTEPIDIQLRAMRHAAGAAAEKSCAAYFFRQEEAGKLRLEMLAAGLESGQHRPVKRVYYFLQDEIEDEVYEIKPRPGFTPTVLQVGDFLHRQQRGESEATDEHRATVQSDDLPAPVPLRGVKQHPPQVRPNSRTFELKGWAWLEGLYDQEVKYGDKLSKYTDLRTSLQMERLPQ